jgi:hypothetical protein
MFCGSSRNSFQYCFFRLSISSRYVLRTTLAISLAYVVSSPLRRSVVIRFRFAVKSVRRVESSSDHYRFAYGESFALATYSSRTSFITSTSSPAIRSSTAVSVMVFIYLPSPSLRLMISRIFSQSAFLYSLFLFLGLSSGPRPVKLRAISL